MNDAGQVTDNVGESRFELPAGGKIAELVYLLRADRLVILHVGVPGEYSGQGLGGMLVQAAVDRAARENLTVVPLCPFARSWLERNPAEAARVAIDLD